MDERTKVIARLKELRQMHAAALGEDDGEAYGFIQDEQSTRKSYALVAEEAMDTGIINKEDLAGEGLEETLERADYQKEFPGEGLKG
jgi:hypothetical protein